MRYTAAILACAGIMAAYCLIGSAPDRQPGGELIRMIFLVVAIDITWRRMTKTKSVDSGNRTES